MKNLSKVTSSVFALLGLCSVAVAQKPIDANWKLIFDNAEKIYVEESTKNTAKGYTRIWVLAEYPDDQNKKLSNRNITFRSTLFYTEFDCNNARSHTLVQHYYAEPKAAGEPIYTVQDIDWNYDIPGGDHQMVAKFVCKGNVVKPGGLNQD